MVAFSTNLGLSALPEYPQAKDPEIYAELVRVRNALRVLQAAIDGIGGVGGMVVTHPAGALSQHAVTVGDGAGGIYTLPSLGILGQILTSVGPGADPGWGAKPSYLTSAYVNGDNTGDVTTSSAVYVTFAGISVSIPAVVGNVIKIDFSVCVQSNTAGATTYIIFGLFCNATHTGQSSVLGITQAAAATIQIGSYSFIRVVQAGDLSAGNFVCDIRYKNSGGGANSFIKNSTAAPDTVVPLLTLTNYG